MVSTIIPKILFNQYFWFIIAFGLIVMIHFACKKSPPPFPRAGKSIEKRTKRITTILDILLISLIILWSYIMFSFVRGVYRASHEPESIRAIFQQSDLTITFALLIIWSGSSGSFVGYLSVFHSNITIRKRIILLIVCSLPIVFTILQMLTGYTESYWLTIQLCLVCSMLSWAVNMPVVITGSSSYELLAEILKKVKLIFSHHAS